MTLPTAPSRTMDQDTFDATTDAFIGALPQFETDMNALAAAMTLNATTDTSSSSVAIGTGAKTFTVSSGKSFWPGMWLVIADTAAPTTNAMFCQVTSYSGTTLIVNSVSTQGSGTIASWQISQSAPAALGGLYAELAGATFTGPVVLNQSVAAAITDYAADFQGSGSTTNAGRTLFSQGSTYALAVAVSSSSTTNALADWQWINRATGALQSTGLRLTYAGDVLCASPTGMIGHGTGAGGSVTQTTSKSTAVTLSKPCGRITTHNASLAAGASVEFQVTNTLVASTDVVHVSAYSFGGSYRIESRVAVGAFFVRITNITGSPLTDAIDLNFVVINVVTA